MSYIGNTDFTSENLHLRQPPKNAKEAYNKLVCLMELKHMCSPNDYFLDRPLSKRHWRILKAYWVFRRREL